MARSAPGPRRSRCDERGFTLLEVVVVMAVLAVLAGSMVPVAGAARDGERTLQVELELERIATALEGHYADHARFPSSLEDPVFVAAYLDASVDGRVLLDDWSMSADRVYGYAGGRDPDYVTVYSVGPDGEDDGARREELRIDVYGAVPGNRRTRERLAVIGAALEDFLRRGGELSGDWDRDRAMLRLGASFASDGFGRPFRSSAVLADVHSGGADRRFGTEDDLGL